MADHIKFVFVFLPDPLKKEMTSKYHWPKFPFAADPATVEITVTGAEDPLTHQRMRDLVSDLFHKSLSQAQFGIKSACGSLNAASKNRWKETLANQTRILKSQLDKSLADFKSQAQHRLDDFCKKEAQNAAKVEEALRNETWNNVKWVITIGWKGITGVMGLFEAGGEIATGNVLAIKDFVDTLKDLQELAQDILDTVASEEQIRVRVVDAMKQLQAKKTFSKSDVDSLDGNVKLYESKLLALEMKAKALTKKVVSTMQAVPKEGITDKARKDAETGLQKDLDELIKLNKAVELAKKNLGKFKIKLGAAKALARNDPTWVSLRGFAGEIYGKINEYLGKLNCDPESIKDTIDGLVDRFGITKNVIEVG